MVHVSPQSKSFSLYSWSNSDYYPISGCLFVQEDLKAFCVEILTLWQLCKHKKSVHWEVFNAL